jgi:hypothetical protein
VPIVARPPFPVDLRREGLLRSPRFPFFEEGKMKLKTLCLAAAAVVLLSWMPAAAAEEVVMAPAPEAQDQAPDACLDYSPVEGTEAQPTLLLGPEMTPAAPGCKTCKDQPFCKCTYQGYRRVSCDPCCYANDIGVYICLS